MPETNLGFDDSLDPHSRRESSAVYDTKYQKSLRHYLTREALPSELNYRNLESIVGGPTRPTIDDLYSDNSIQKHSGKSHDGGAEDDPKQMRGKVIKFGWLEGVLMRCLLNIWGVMLFLRVSWVVGEAGLVFGILIVVLANLITVITTISMSAVATNGQIKAGGIYYMISRSLGPEFGGSIGLLFTLANSIAASTYIIGFVESLSDMCKQYFHTDGLIFGGGGVNDIRVIGLVTLVAVLLLAIVGMDWVTRVQMILLFVLIGSQLDFIAGTFMGPQSDLERSQGNIGLNYDLFQKNIWADYRSYKGDMQSFFTIFGVFFPAVTGIVAGANLSGDLKDPGSAIPKGTLAAIGITFVTYIIYPIMIAGSVFRDATGNETDYQMNRDELNISDINNPVFDYNNTCGFNQYGESYCDYGSQNSFQVMELMAAWGPLIYIGCFAATLSSAIASLVGAPRVLQALAKDRLYPYLHVFEVGWGANNDPVRGYVLVFIISFACIMIGDLNAVSTLLTNCFLASYALINFSCFHATLIKSPGWRPAFKYYNSYISLIGGLMCVIVMFLIDYKTALVTAIAAGVLYMYVSYRKPDVNWGSSTQAQMYVSALKSTLDLVTVEEHVKNYRPQILVLCGNPAFRPPLIDFGHSITKNISFLCCANIVKGQLTQRSRNRITKQAYAWLANHKIRAFYSCMESPDLETGSKALFQICGLGKLRPNMVLVGYKTNWKDCDREELKAYFNTLHEALNMYLAVGILRVPCGLDFSNVLEEDYSSVPNGTEALSTTPIGDSQDPQNTTQIQQEGTESEASTPPGSPAITARNLEPEKTELKYKRKHSISNLYHGIGGSTLPREVLNNLTMFHRKQKGTIDVWWLYDDGGLTLLLPHILSTRSQWAGCKLRVFALANRKNELEMEQRSMANLLAKFRIDYQDMKIIPDLAKKASEASKREFEDHIKNFKAGSDDSLDKEDEGFLISEAELLGQKEKTNRHIRLRELLIEHSKDASLIVMTLPMPRKNSVSAPLYMAWIEMLSKGMPPFLLIRGNQTSVLTFYS